MPYKDPAVARAKRREYYLRNRDWIKARVRQYRADHEEERRGYSRRHYRDNSDRYKENVRRWQQEHQFPYHGILDRAGVERRCVECGAVDDLCVHHIDGNHGNDSLDNLQWMCMSCHSRLHARIRREAVEAPSEAREGAVGASVPVAAPEAEEGPSEGRGEVS